MKGWYLDNKDLFTTPLVGLARPRRVAIEMIANMGMTIGYETLETCLWIGSITKTLLDDGVDVRLVYRKKDVCEEICGNSTAKDKNIRAALIDLYPPRGGGSIPQKGTSKNPGPLFGIANHMWSALAVAVSAAERWERLEKPPQSRDA